MIKVCIIANEAYNKNRLFNLEDRELNRDNCLLPFWALRESLWKQNIDIATSDIYLPEDCNLNSRKFIPMEE